MAKGKYSKVISVEMIEAVGKDFIPQYFEIISDRLSEGGIAALQVPSPLMRMKRFPFQAIICPDAYYANYCKSSDFIKKYIFPGGHMPSIGKKNSSERIWKESFRSHSEFFAKRSSIREKRTHWSPLCENS